MHRFVRKSQEWRLSDFRRSAVFTSHSKDAITTLMGGDLDDCGNVFVLRNDESYFNKSLGRECSVTVILLMRFPI